jgi:hypothetical protein
MLSQKECLSLQVKQSRHPPKTPQNAAKSIQKPTLAEKREAKRQKSKKDNPKE